MKTFYFIGTSGWSYNHWLKRFYPPDIPPGDMLPFYAKSFSTVEINSSFYRLPFENMVLGWKKKTPANFTFAVKISRLITHYKRLKEVDDSLDLFFSRISLLGKKVGPILHQLPPSLQKNERLLGNYLSLLPKNFLHTVEFRNKSWLTSSIYKLLKKHKVAFCIISLQEFPLVLEVTADFVYIRLHGPEALYGSCYTEEDLSWWKEQIKGFVKQGLKVYVYFNNDYSAYAIENAQQLKQLLAGNY